MNKIPEIGIIIFLFVLTSFVCTKLDHKFDVPWKYVLIPLYLLAIDIFVPVINYMAMTIYRKEPFDSYSFVFGEGIRPVFMGALAFFWLDILKPKDFIKQFLWVFMWILGIILLSLKISGVGIHSAIVSVPFHIAFYVPLYMIVKRPNLLGDDLCFERLYFVPITVAISVFMILLAIQIESNVFWSWHIVFIPLYFVDFLAVGYLAYPAIGTIAGIHTGYGPRSYSGYILAFVGLFDLFVMIPLLIFKILLGLTLDGIKDYSFSSIFSPLFILESFGTILYLFFVRL